MDHLPSLLLALITGIASNVFIVGINQIADVNIDRINKPWLPIPAQRLSVREAKWIVFAMLVICLSVSFYLTPYFMLIIALACTIGWAYSMPPCHLKRHHLPAAIAISFVRGILVNLGAFLVFTQLVQHDAVLPKDLLLLTIFITVCGIVIAWFKDLPDIEGDARYAVKTFAVVHSPRAAFITGTLLMCAAYIFIIVMYAITTKENAGFTRALLLYGHIALFLLFIVNTFSVKLRKQQSVNVFYKRFWAFFFAEYILYMIAYW
jgi:homogentisate phytyltransferase / homogentisate geranylgeranyltransferase